MRFTWYEVTRAAGASEEDCERIKGAFAYPGFDLEGFQPVDDTSNR